MATGRDYADVAPTSGTYVGTAQGTLTATKRVGVVLVTGGTDPGIVEAPVTPVISPGRLLPGEEVA